MDKLTAEQRSRLMARVRSKDTKPELLVRRLAHRMGYRYRLHDRSLPGTPDLVFAGRRKVIFVNGCFWHGHSCRSGRNRPASHQAFWREKLERTKERDRNNRKALRREGWGLLTLWECQIGEEERLARRLRAFLEPA